MKTWKWPMDLKFSRAAKQKSCDEQQIQKWDQVIRSQIADLDRWVDNRFPLSTQIPLDRS